MVYFLYWISILFQTLHIQYNYSNEWLDQLESTVTTIYDQHGSIVSTEISQSFIYDNQGYRTSKTVDGVTIKYHLQGDKVLLETNRAYAIIYTYDYDGKLISFNYDSIKNDNIKGIEYFYIRNQQGDITKIVDKDGTIVVEYMYGAWGKLLEIDGSLASTIGEINPYRYRGYRYEEETSMYYLNSRFYDANIGRFINADGLLGQQGNILGHNMYAYTQNNPVMYSDISGEFPVLIALVVGGAIIGGGSQYIANVINGANGADRWEGVIGASIGGAIALPMIIASTPAAALGLALASGYINGTVNEIERSVKYGKKFSLGSAMYDSVIYSGLNMIPVTRNPWIAGELTLGIDTLGFTLADKYKDDFINGIDNSVYNFKQGFNKNTYDI